MPKSLTNNRFIFLDTNLITCHPKRSLRLNPINYALWNYLLPDRFYHLAACRPLNQGFLGTRHFPINYIWSTFRNYFKWSINGHRYNVLQGAPR